MLDHNKEWAASHAVRLEQLRQDFLAKYDALQYVQIEGVVECTLRSSSHTITVGINSMELTQVLIEAVDKKLDDIEERIVHHKVTFAQELNESPALASQATVTAAPTQRGPGRPRKVQPQPEVMAAVGAAAAQVPMNHGSTGQAVGRAVNQPQG